MFKYILSFLLLISPAYADGLIVPPPSLPLSVANGGTGYDGGSLQTYTPTVTASAGSFGSATSGGSYLAIGKIVFVNLYIGITTVGSATGRPAATIPVGTANGGFILSCRETRTGIAATGYIASATNYAAIVSYNNSATLLADNNMIICTGFLHSELINARRRI